MKIATGEHMKPYRNYRIHIGLLAAVLLVACASVPEPRGLREGIWTLYQEGGTQTDVVVTELYAWEYRFSAPNHPISGTYQMDGDRVSITDPDNPRMKEFVWLLRSDRSLILVSEPPVELSGMRLTASTLVGPR